MEGSSREALTDKFSYMAWYSDNSSSVNGYAYTGMIWEIILHVLVVYVYRKLALLFHNEQRTLFWYQIVMKVWKTSGGCTNILRQKFYDCHWIKHNGHAFRQMR